MSSLNLIAYREGTGPIIDPLDDLGVANPTHRYVASTLPGVHGSDVTTWLDLGSLSNPITSPAATGNTLNLATGPYPFAVVTSGTNALVNTSNESHPVSFALIAKKASVNSTLMTLGGISLSRASDGTFQMSTSGTHINVAGSGEWECIVGTCNTAGQPSRLSVATATATTTATPTANNPVSIVRGGVGNSTSVVELVIWSGLALSNAQHDAILAAAQAAYPSLAL